MIKTFWSEFHHGHVLKIRHSKQSVLFQRQRLEQNNTLEILDQKPLFLSGLVPFMGSQ